MHASSSECGTIAVNGTAFGTPPHAVERREPLKSVWFASDRKWGENVPTKPVWGAIYVSNLVSPRFGFMRPEFLNLESLASPIYCVFRAFPWAPVYCPTLCPTSLRKIYRTSIKTWSQNSTVLYSIRVGSRCFFSKSEIDCVSLCDISMWERGLIMSQQTKAQLLGLCSSLFGVDTLAPCGSANGWTELEY